MAYGTKGRIKGRKPPQGRLGQTSVSPKGKSISTSQSAGRAIGSGLSKRVGKGTAGKTGRVIGGAGGGRKPFMTLGGGSVPKKPKRKPAKRKSRR